ncbi:MAG: hypothetical protein U0746_11745 [Gemmataceae bacterium]
MAADFVLDAQSETVQSRRAFRYHDRMARCDEGYLCDVCGEDVGEITVSDLYLRYVLGEIPLYELQRSPERHLHCNPALAQYIVDAAFVPVVCTGPFAKELFDAAYVASEEARVTAGWRRLQELPSLGLPIDEYPLFTRG